MENTRATFLDEVLALARDIASLSTRVLALEERS